MQENNCKVCSVRLSFDDQFMAWPGHCLKCTFKEIAKTIKAQGMKSLPTQYIPDAEEDAIVARELEQKAMMVRLQNLAKCLEVGSSLCMAFYLGQQWTEQWEQREHVDGWRPGCGRAWGGEL